MSRTRKRTRTGAEAIPWMDIGALGGAMARGELSPVQVTQAYLDRIRRLNPRLKAYLSVYPEQALKAARRAGRELRAGNRRGPLHGVPVAVKDIFQAEGMETTCGSPAYRDELPAGDCTAVARLKEAGAILLGKLNLHEFAFGPSGINRHFGSARNPWNLERFAGGSSSGSGCATAAALAAGTLGSDTGGSIRIPAALCGIVGLKQTYGVVSRNGIYPVCAQFDHAGPMTRTVRDAALMLSVLGGEDPKDPSTRGMKRKDYTKGLRRGIEGLRIGVPKNAFFDGLLPDVERAVREAIRKLEELGATVRPVELPFMDEVRLAWNQITLPEAYAVHEAHLAAKRVRLGADVQERLTIAKRVSGTDYVKAQWTRDAVKAQMAEIMSGIDLIAAPTVPLTAGPIDGSPVRLGRRKIDPHTVLGLLSRLASFTGQPAISLPCGFSAEGLPIGLQLIGRWYEEGTVLRAAHAYEQAAEWVLRRPPGLG